MTTKERKNVYQIITDRMVDELKNGNVPWHKPWNASEGGAPMNVITKKAYRGVNVFLLISNGFEHNLYATYKQFAGVGAEVRKGEKGTPIVFWNWVYDCPTCGKLKQQQVERGHCKACGAEVDGIPYLRYYTVFNIAQVDGLPAKYQPKKVETKKHNPIKAAEEIVAKYTDAPEVEHQGGRACYSPMQDLITMPRAETFDNEEEYYSTLFHEFAHSTGHESRLKRDLEGWFESEDYSKEELVAEMAAAFLSAESGIESKTLDNSAAYIRGWCEKLQSNPKWIVFAAAQGQKAAHHINKPSKKASKKAA